MMGWRDTENEREREGGERELEIKEIALWRQSIKSTDWNFKKRYKRGEEDDTEK